MRDRAKLNDRDRRIADLANELVDIPVGWLDHQPYVDPEALVEFREKFKMLLDAIHDRSDLVDVAIVATALLRLDSGEFQGELPFERMGTYTNPPKD